MNEKLTDKAIINKQGKLIRSYRATLEELRTEAKKVLEYCKDNGFKESRIAGLIVEKADSIIFRHDLFATRIEEIRTGIVKGQTQIPTEGSN